MRKQPAPKLDPAHQALVNGIEARDAGAVRMALEMGANQLLPELVVALMAAAMKGDVEIANLLLDAGADVNGTQASITPLMGAIYESRRAMVRLLLDRGASLTSVNNTDSTPLHLACVQVDVQIPAMLLDAGANIEAVQVAGLRPLHDALLDGFEDAAHLLIDRGATLEDLDGKGNSALHLIGGVDDAPLMAKLIGTAKSVDQTNQDGETPLLALCLWQGRGRTESILPALTALLDAGANANAVGQMGARALHYLARSGDGVAIEKVVARGAHVDVGDVNRATALHHAMMKNRSEAARALLEAGADPEKRTASGENAEDIGRARNALDALGALRSWQQDRHLDASIPEAEAAPKLRL